MDISENHRENQAQDENNLIGEKYLEEREWKPEKNFLNECRNRQDDTQQKKRVLVKQQHKVVVVLHPNPHTFYYIRQNKSKETTEHDHYGQKLYQRHTLWLNTKPSKKLIQETPPSLNFRIEKTTLYCIAYRINSSISFSTSKNYTNFRCSFLMSRWFCETTSSADARELPSLLSFAAILRLQREAVKQRK